MTVQKNWDIDSISKLRKYKELIQPEKLWVNLWLFKWLKTSFLCLKSVRIRSYSGPHFLAYFVFLRFHSNYEKIRARITPYTDTFYAVIKC